MAQSAADEKKLQNETVTKLRTLSHDLSNYIETIMQASYLLAQSKLDDNERSGWKWLIKPPRTRRASIARSARFFARKARDCCFGFYAAAS